MTASCVSRLKQSEFNFRNENIVCLKSNDKIVKSIYKFSNRKKINKILISKSKFFSDSVCEGVVFIEEDVAIKSPRVKYILYLKNEKLYFSTNNKSNNLEIISGLIKGNQIFADSAKKVITDLFENHYLVQGKLVK